MREKAKMRGHHAGRKKQVEKMDRTVAALYEGGVFRPLEPLELPDHTKVRLTVETEQEAGAKARAILELARKSFEGLSDKEIAALEASRLNSAQFFSPRGPVS